MRLVRISAALPLLALAGFCVFGFLATFEPMDREGQVTLRIGYALVGVGNLLAPIWLIFKKPAKPTSHSAHGAD